MIKGLEKLKPEYRRCLEKFASKLNPENETDQALLFTYALLLYAEQEKQFFTKLLIDLAEELRKHRKREMKLMVLSSTSKTKLTVWNIKLKQK